MRFHLKILRIDKQIVQIIHLIQSVQKKGRIYVSA